MGVYIPGMEMPKNCDECPLLTEDGDYDVCFVGKRRVMWEWKHDRGSEVIHPKPDWCPLIELPPHGRLIDADALLAEYERDEKAADEHGREFSFSFKRGGENCTEWWPVQQKLMDAPTIIPANSPKEAE